ncbi:MAG: leucine-rich repeat domain-containing protein, partial [Lachnospiraceae bacterium]|nr:leucine-rich repeat domain-containing protein [Lachnospiraceae bacterium]
MVVVTEKRLRKCRANRNVRVWGSCKKAALRLFVLMLLVVFTFPNGRVKAETDDTVSEIDEELAVNEAPVVDSQPAGITCYNNVTVKFSFKVSGTGLKYRWQTSKNGGSTWADSSMTGYNTDTVSVAATLTRSGYMFRCIVTDANGNTLTSDAARLNVLEADKPVTINKTNFPDDVFRNYVSENYDIDNNGVLSVDEISEATGLLINGYGSELTSVEGICLLNKLEYIECNDNAVKSIDMYNFPSLDVLLCWNNDLTHIELSGCSSIKTFKCYMNKLTSLDISALPNIEILDCSENKLRSLNVKNCSALTNLICDDNDLTELSLKGCYNLTEFSCDENDISNIEFSDCHELESFSCYDNEITTALDFSNCTKLKWILCYENQISTITIGDNSVLESILCDSNRLTELNLGECPVLETIWCHGNLLTNLNISGCPNIESLLCSNNKLTSLNLSSCSNLKTLWCNTNKLTGLDLSNLTKLDVITCGTNKISELNVSHLTDLRILDCTNCCLSSLDVSNCPKLETLKCAQNQISELDLSNCPGLYSLEINNTNIESLDISNCEMLSYAVIYTDPNAPGFYYSKIPYKDKFGNDITVWLKFDPTIELYTMYFAPSIEKQPEDLSTVIGATAKFRVKARGDKLKYQWKVSTNGGNTWKDSGFTGNNTDTLTVPVLASRNGYKFKCVITDSKNVVLTSDIVALTIKIDDTMVIIDENNFPDSIFRAYVSDNFDTNGDGLLSSEEIADAKNIDISESELSSVDGIKFLTELEYVKIGYTQIKELDLTNHKKIVYLYLWYNELENIKITGCSELKHFSCDDNKITSIDLTGCNKLVSVEVYWNELTEIILDYCPDMESLYCYCNKLTSLDLSKTPNLRYLNCGWNNISRLDFTKTPELENLSFYSNNLSIFDLSNCTKLKYLRCDFNGINSLDLSECTELKNLDCSYNKIDSLDLSSCTELKELDCHNNKLTKLDISSLPNLYTIKCKNNSITLLDITNNNCLCRVYATEPTSPGEYSLEFDDVYDMYGFLATGELSFDSSVRILNDYKAPAFTTQPSDITADPNASVNFKVVASGTDLLYQWQTSKDGGKTWLNSKMTGYNTDTLTVSAIPERNNYKFRCIVADIKNNSATSKAATLKVKSSTTITSQPQNVTAVENTTVQFSVSANGEGLKYQWQTSKNNGQTWVNSSMSGCKTNTLNVVAIADRNGYMFRCVITDKNNISIESNAAKLTVTSQSELKITSQPADVTTPADATVQFSVTASGTGLKYQWQTSKDGGSTWVNSGMSGYNTNTLNVLAVAARNGYKFRCVVTDKFGKTVTSNAATLTIGASTGTKITS